MLVANKRIKEALRDEEKTSSYMKISSSESDEVETRENITNFDSHED